MKCIKLNEEIRKVSNEEAIDMVKKGWAYCAKSYYKKLHGKVKVEKKELVEGDEIIVKKSKPIKMSKEDRMKGKSRIGGSKGG